MCIRDRGLHDGDEVPGADLPDTVHPVKAHQDAAAERDAPSHVADAGTPGSHGNIVPVCVGKDCRNLLGGARGDGDLRQGGRKPLIGAQLGKSRWVGDDPGLGRDQLPEIPLQGGAGGF